MYMKPTFAVGGALCSIQAVAHSSAFLSMHIGSGPGVVGLPGMQVQPFVPLRTSRILPSCPMAMIVAPLLIELGAADSALLMSFASLIGAILCCCAKAGAAKAAQLMRKRGSEIQDRIVF